MTSQQSEQCHAACVLYSSLGWSSENTQKVNPASSDCASCTYSRRCCPHYLRKTPPTCLCCTLLYIIGALSIYEYAYSTSREVNGAWRPHGCSRPCAFEEKKREGNEIPPHPEHTTKSTEALRPRPPRDGVRRSTFRALADSRPLP